MVTLIHLLAEWGFRPMTWGSVTRPDVEAAFLAVLRVASEQGFTVTRTKVAKLLYLCDLRAVETGLDPFTGVHWKWLHYGPFDRDLLTLEESLVSRQRVERTMTQNYFGTPEYRLTVDADISVSLAGEFWDIVRSVVVEFGRYAPSTLRDITYQTPPMQTAQEHGQREVDLDLSEIRPTPGLGSVVRRLRAVRDRLGDQTTEDGAFDDLRAEMDELAPARTSANRMMLDE
jgi:uncharacterized phage-associated protein